MKFTCMKWSAWPVLVLMAGTVVLAEDLSAAGSQEPDEAQSGSSAPAATPASAPTPAATPAAAPTPAAKPKPTVARRKENQQDRIAQGVKSGQLTAGETSKLETKEAALNADTKADRAAHGGKLTAAEKKQINGQQNQLSKQIGKDKHNASTQHYANNKVDQRRENQQDRVAQGIKSGQMTAGEAAKAEKQQKGINRQVAADRQANGGTLTASEKKQVNHEQNVASKNIYRKKHNLKTQPQEQPKPN